MIILDGAKLREYWDNIAQGFQKSPLEAAISVLIIAILFVIPIIFFFHRQKKDRNRKRRRALQVFEVYATKRKLSEGDRELLREMCRYVSKKELELPNLVTKSARFNAAAKRFVQDDKPDSDREARISGLRLKLGLTLSGARGILHSTAEFYRGMPLQVAVESGRKYVGEVQDVKPEGIFLKVPEKLAKGTLVELRVKRSSGLYSLTTKIIGVQGNSYHLQHSERVERVQKRRFFRKVLRLPVLLATEDQSVFKSRLIDLSAGGAKIRNPGLKANPGEVVHLKIFPNQGDPIKLKSRVTRESSDGSSLSVAFDLIKDSTRDQLMKLVFS